MKSIFDANGFLQVAFDNHANENTNNNSDKYTFTITTNGGQSMIVDNKVGYWYLGLLYHSSGC